MVMMMVMVMVMVVIVVTMVVMMVPRHTMSVMLERVNLERVMTVRVRMVLMWTEWDWR